MSKLPNSPGEGYPKTLIQTKRKRKWLPKIPGQAVIVLTVVLIIVIILVLIFFLNVKRNSSKNVPDLFGDKFDIQELNQIQSRSNLSKHLGKSLRNFRTYNPCLFTLSGIANKTSLYFVYRVSNFALCPGQKLLWDKNFREETLSQTFIESSEGDLFRIDHPTISGSKCEQGCEDARSFVCQNRVYVVGNATSGENCRRQMVMMEFDVLQFLPIETQLNENELSNSRNVYEKKELNVKDIRPLSMRKLNTGFDNDRDQKNWMPLIMDDHIHFVYSINPHVILRYTGPHQDRNNGFDIDDRISSDFLGEINCEKYSESTNDKLPNNLRGGGQIVKVRKWNKINSTGKSYRKTRYRAEDLYLGVVHSRDSTFEYSTYFYAFEVDYPHRVKYLSSGFVFGDKSNRTKIIQFASGLAQVSVGTIRPENYLYITYGEQDCNAKLCILKEEDVLRSLKFV